LRALISAALLLPASARADEPLQTTDDPPPRKSASVADPARPEAPPAPEDKLSRALESREERPGVELERLERAIQAMRQAGQRIGADDTGAETAGLQKGAIEELEQLIELLQRQRNRNDSPPPRPNPDQNQNPNQNQNQNQNGQQRQAPRRQQLDPQNSGNRPQPTRGQGNPSRSPEEKARDSEERLNTGKVPLDEDARRQQMLKDVWGHLPPHVREAMRNNMGEKYLPRYEELIKRYYETLAEKNRDRTNRRP
jgi:hypothetical protein